MKEKIEDYYLKQIEPNRSVLFALRDIILNYHEFISEEWKYGLPSYYYNKKPFCYIWKDKKTSEPYIGIARGFQMEHPSLIQGDRTRIKIFPIPTNQDIDINTIYQIFDEASKLYK
ncbi:DUF1801 domain-containing protein [Flavicella sp.]|uniref:DUF1801 domain-containing protein n=1 Tax=Flavicella sp. TaxID=2957742 RepID=UPI0026341307|nr:DUF1801 domain-containing protein [Flavicella sp.]MDG1803911.1 DUF1801 domain-containing protein [Flavicella sp.]MDG2281073.1 DUF1801 domain-containing protein [Flavicella sp.]